MATVYIEYIDIGSIVIAVRNPKEHDTGAIWESMCRFGYVLPGVIDEATGRLVAGHGRLQALRWGKVNGYKPPKGIMVDGDRWSMPIVRGVEFRDEAEAEAYLIADNRLVVLGGWDEGVLADSLSGLMAQGEELLRGVGYDGDDVDALLRRQDRLDKKAAYDNKAGERRWWRVVIDNIDGQDKADQIAAAAIGQGYKATVKAV